MNIDEQVCSLELSKRLKELGVKQESYFEYLFIPYLYEWKVSSVFKTQLGLSAFTVAELGEILPDNFTTWLDNEKLYRDHFFHEIKVKDEYLIEYRINDKPNLSQCIKDKKEADARAKMLVYLLENKLMDLP